MKATGPSGGDFNTTEEFDKTVFEKFLTVDPGRMDTLEILYKLPDSIFEKIKNGDALRVDTGTLKRVNLPAQFTPFYGREVELEWLAQSLANS